MLFFTGDTRAIKVVTELQRYNIGRVVINHIIKPYPNEKIILDNGAFADRNKGEFDVDRYEKSIAMVRRMNCTPYFAVVPDIYAGGNKSLLMSNEWVKKLSDSTDWRLYLVVQDNMTPSKVKMSLSLYPYSGIFLGGTNNFKLETDFLWKALADKMGLSFHYGRCGTPTKINRAIEIKATSIDSALMLWTKERMDLFIEIVKDNQM